MKRRSWRQTPQLQQRAPTFLHGRQPHVHNTLVIMPTPAIGPRTRRIFILLGVFLAGWVSLCALVERKLLEL